MDDLLRFQAGFRWPRETYDLPGLIEDGRPGVHGQGRRAAAGLAGRPPRTRTEGSRQAIEVPAAIRPHLAWVLDRERFARSELLSAFPGEYAAKIDQLIVDLGRMAVIEPAA